MEVMRDRIYVGGIPWGVQEQELGDFFSRYGWVTHVGIIPPHFNKVVSEVSYSNYSLHPQGHHPFGFVTFGEGEAVVRQVLGGGEGALVLRGVKLQVGPALV